MVLEVVQLQIKPGDEENFEQAMPLAAPQVLNSKGAQSLRLKRCVETPGKYFVLIEWDAIEDHLEGFRNSAAFVEWRRILSPFFAQPPFVEHFDEVII